MTTPSLPTPAEAPAATVTDENQLIAERREKLAALRATGIAFPNDFKPRDHAADLHRVHESKTNEELEPQALAASVAGRMMLKRVMGKACFATLQDGTGRIQLYITADAVGLDALAAFKHWDLGDIVGAEGQLFKTRTGELSIRVTSLRLLTKSLRPLPDKFHGMADQELKYRQRYVDLIMDETSRERFKARSKAITTIRGYMIEHGFFEIESPILHPIPGGANARPFKTHHNALDQPMFLRIAQELYIKRVMVGGFERVFEINRNFRNEGVSVRHNPEFTMMEYNAAYWTYHDMMDFTEALLRHTARTVTGSAVLSYDGRPVDLEAPFARLSIRDALQKHLGITPDEADDPAVLRQRLEAARAPLPPASASLPELQFALFEAAVEEQLWEPTFIIDHPVEVSPLARASDTHPGLTERFELFMTRREFANGFSELNDPEDQAARFMAQAEQKDAGNEEAMFYDADYIRALEYGLPPNAGGGIGIDRFIMLLTDAPNIRDVILFPALRRTSTD